MPLSYPHQRVCVEMNLPHHDVWGGSSHGQVVYPQPDEQREIEHSFPESPAFPLGTPPSQDVNAEAFFPIVDPPPILACESGSSDSAFWGGAYAAFYNAVPPSRRQTYPIPLVPRLPFQGVTSDDSVPNRRALTIPVPSRAAPYTHLTFGGSPPDPFPHSGSSQAPVYGTNFVSSPTSVSQDQPLPQTGEESVSPGPITSLGNSRVDHIPTHLSFFGLPLTPPDGVPQQVSILVPSPSADRDLVRAQSGIARALAHKVRRRSPPLPNASTVRGRPGGGRRPRVVAHARSCRWGLASYTATVAGSTAPRCADPTLFSLRITTRWRSRVKRSVRRSLSCYACVVS